MKLAVSFRGHVRDIEVDESLELEGFQAMIEQETDVPADLQKLLAPKVGMIKVDKLEKGDQTPVSEIFADGSRIMVIGNPMQKIEALRDAETAAATKSAQAAKRLEHLRKNTRRAYVSKSTISEKSEAAQYTFDRLEPLPFLPDPESARALLQRIRDDRGIRAIMTRYKWRVGTLGELDPASNTTHEKRLLGLNTNKGEKIQLRLRTDDYGGFCSYKEIIKVLCHELAHNVHGPHDRAFWDLTNKLERQVLDWDPFGRSGKRIGEAVYDGPGLGIGDGSAEQLHVDEGGWYGSTQVLGGADSSSGAGSSSSSDRTPDRESLRDKMARAAERSAKRDN